MRFASKFSTMLVGTSALVLLSATGAQAQAKPGGAPMAGGGITRSPGPSSTTRAESVPARTNNNVANNVARTGGGNSDPLCRRRNADGRCELDRILDRRFAYQAPITAPNGYVHWVYDGDGQDLGFEDGLRTGARDAFSSKSYYPQRSHFFKSGVPEGRSVFFSDAFRQTYRDGFLRGYEEGFRNYQSYFVNGKFRR